MRPLDPIATLKQRQLKSTWQRVRVLEEIIRESAAVSQPILERKLGAEIDRVTLYRILNTYENKGILHRIIDRHGTANYAMCSPSCSTQQHRDEHLHFCCNSCGKIYCWETKIPEINAPNGFQIDSQHFILYGLCNQCNEAAKG